MRATSESVVVVRPPHEVARTISAWSFVEQAALAISAHFVAPMSPVPTSIAQNDCLHLSIVGMLPNVTMHIRDRRDKQEQNHTWLSHG